MNSTLGVKVQWFMHINVACVKPQIALVKVMNDVTETWINVLLG